MKYAKTRVKCSDSLITELLNFKAFCASEKESVFIEDFLYEVIDGVVDTMSLARLADDLDENECAYMEFFIQVPQIVWNYVKKYVAQHEEGYKEIELFFDEISRVKERSFRR